MGGVQGEWEEFRVSGGVQGEWEEFRVSGGVHGEWEGFGSVDRMIKDKLYFNVKKIILRCSTNLHHTT